MGACTHAFRRAQREERGLRAPKSPPPGARARAEGFVAGVPKALRQGCAARLRKLREVVTGVLEHTYEVRNVLSRMQETRALAALASESCDLLLGNPVWNFIASTKLGPIWAIISSFSTTRLARFGEPGLGKFQRLGVDQGGSQKGGARRPKGGGGPTFGLNPSHEARMWPNLGDIGTISLGFVAVM